MASDALIQHITLPGGGAAYLLAPGQMPQYDASKAQHLAQQPTPFDYQRVRDILFRQPLCADVFCADDGMRCAVSLLLHEAGWKDEEIEGADEATINAELRSTYGITIPASKIIEINDGEPCAAERGSAVLDYFDTVGLV